MSSSEGDHAQSEVILQDVAREHRPELHPVVFAGHRPSLPSCLRRLVSLIARACIPALLLLLTWPNGSEATGAQYVYDAAGRLVQAIAPNGSSAQYSYDSAGNLLAVTPLSASTAALTGFSNASGATGSTLTIYGSGFSTTPGNNLVYFNGVAATVVSSTTNSLTVTVPSGATTGTVTVTDSNGTVTSGHNFIVSAGLLPPVISSFSPAIGTPGTAVTVSGSNFATSTSSGETAYINGVASSIASTTASSLSLTVPTSATSGPITVDTTTGVGTSGSMFFIPPSGVSASAIATTGQLTIGGSPLTATIGTGGEFGLIAFNALAGETVSLLTSGQTFASSCADGTIYWYQPNTASYFGPTDFCTQAVNVFLPTTGTYTLFLVPYGTNTGSITLQLQSAPVITVPIAIGGSPVTLVTTVPAQQGQLTFTTTSANQVVSLQVSGMTYPTSCANLLLNVNGPAPASTPVVTNSNVCPAAQLITLPTVGTYTITITPWGTEAVGSVTIQLQNAPPATASATIGGSSVTLTTTVPAQESQLTFTTTTANQIVSLQFLSNTYSTSCANLILDVNGPSPSNTSVLLNGSVCPAAQLITLPTAGTYTITIIPYNTTAVGSLTVKLQNAPIVTGYATVGGSAVTLTTTVPAQLSLLYFTTTTANELIYIYSSGSTYPSGDCGSDAQTLWGPAPAYPYILSSTVCDAWAYTTLATAGTYALWLTPSGTDTGSITYQLYQ
jgi:YD repeat-containing protein